MKLATTLEALVASNAELQATVQELQGRAEKEALLLQQTQQARYVQDLQGQVKGDPGVTEPSRGRLARVKRFSHKASCVGTTVKQILSPRHTSTLATVLVDLFSLVAGRRITRRTRRRRERSRSGWKT